MLFKSASGSRADTFSQKQGEVLWKVQALQTAPPPVSTARASLFALFCSHALAIALINYTSLVAVATEVRKCTPRVQRRREGKKEKEGGSQETEKREERVQKAGGGEAEKTGFREWLLRDQPCVRLASGDINTSDAAEATILPFTAGEGDKRALTKGKREKALRGAGLPPLPPGQQPHLQVPAPPDESKNKRGACSFPIAPVSRLY